MNALMPLADAAFVARLEEHLREDYAETVVRYSGGESAVKSLPDALLSKMVRAGLRRGRAHGLKNESDLAAFVALMFAAAPNFDEHPLLRRILTDDATEPAKRIALLLEQTTEQNWEAVRQNYRPAAWETS